MLLVESKVLKDCYINGMGGYDFYNIPQIATRLASLEKHSQVIRIVFGATKEMPFRALSYLLPPLLYMNNLWAAGVVVPQLQIIFANNISCHLDRIDYTTAHDQSSKLVSVASRYMSEFFPNLEEKVVFLEDTPLDKGSDLRMRLLEITAFLKRITSVDMIRDLQNKATNNGAGRMYAFYGAAHLLIHDLAGDFRILSPQFYSHIVEPDAIISFGGKQEEIFYRLRHHLKPYLNSEYRQIPTLQFFTRHRVPPYYMARDGDLSLDDAIRRKRLSSYHNISVSTRYDLDYLDRISYTRGNYESFVKGIGRKK